MNSLFVSEDEGHVFLMVALDVGSVGRGPLAKVIVVLVMLIYFLGPILCF